MVIKNLLDFIKTEIKQNRSEQEIKGFLVEKGWSINNVEEAFRIHRAMLPIPLKPVWLRKIFTIEIPLWLTFIILTLILGISTAIIFSAKEKVYSYNLTTPDKPSPEKNIFEYGSQPSLSNPDFFKKTERRFLTDGVSFIEANLETMKLSVYQDGKLVKTVPIVAKGKEGVWWETPAGLYKIESREKNHFSSFGKVFQPWSLAFQGNFFIHGWPYYENGTPVASSFSGGCIRLSSEDAEEIFNLAVVGMPVLVFEKNNTKDDFNYETSKPEITAKKYLAADLKNNFVFLQKDSNISAPIASVTKLITALVAAEYINLDKNITITNSMIVKTSKARLAAGESIGSFQLLYPLLLESSNEAAEALSQSIGRDRFVKFMNAKAASLGMTETKFVDPSGSGDGNISNAEELFSLAKYIYNNRSFIWQMSAGTLNHTAYGSVSFKGIGNFNLFGGREDFIGGKVGQTTAAGETMVALFDLEVRGEKRPIAIIILGSTDEKGDVEKILEYVKVNYR
ncbi:MAG: hypothetical protein EXS46_02940 [Candidatus Taylorbacteria bacterium]|nr:hypothetical protein [Candidatus Taylorbacteria bacterium]